MSNEHHVIGPPGTGKTTYIAKQIERAAEKHGPENVIVSSFTKAAATELNHRQLPIPRENIGTLHALCFRALKKYNYEIAEIKAQEFNDQNPGAKITVDSKNSLDEMAADAVFLTEGDRHLNTYNLFRAKCLNLSGMPSATINWVRKWEVWKSENNYIDFTDMINLTVVMNEPFPGNPTVGIYDECQDFNKLELNLIRHWAKFQDHIILSGDDDQSIYGFAGSDPEVFIGADIPQENKRMLRQSWRLPKMVHHYSQQWIKQVKYREPKYFDPKDIEGNIVRSKATCKTPEAVIDMAARYAQDGKTVMILASCGYLLNEVKRQLRENGLPFHNQYRPNRGDWNPMGSFHKSQSGRVSTRERILAFLDSTVTGRWTLGDLDKWTDMIKIKDVLHRGAKDRIQLILDNKELMIDEQSFYNEIFKDFALQMAMERNLDWFREKLLSTKRTASIYPLTVYEKQGRKALEKKPLITIGTVHSVKGGEASVVILFPDLSQAAMNEYEHDKDETIRTFYVGMTRAADTLVLCQPSSMMCVKMD